MDGVVELPLWAAYITGVGAPVGAFVGGLVGQLLSREPPPRSTSRQIHYHRQE